MKYSSIKKVALGLFLAAYATSSVFASQTVTATNAIQGNEPILRAASGLNDTFDHTVTVTVSTDETGNTPIGNRAAKVNDFIVITYAVIDADDDADNGAVKDKLKVFYKDISTNDWVDATSKVELKTPPDQNNRVSFRITEDFAGVSKIGFQLLETTKYGVPNTNKWLLTTDIWATNKPNVVKNDLNDANNNPKNPGGDDNNGDPFGPGVVTAGSGNGPIESSNLRIGIFKYNKQSSSIEDTRVNYAATNSTEIPKYGDTFKVVVWLDKAGGTPNVFEPAVDKDITTSYKYKWTLSGTYMNKKATETEELNGTSSSVNPSENKIRDIITLGSEKVGVKHNAMYSASYYAGAQGYNLVVSTTTENR